MQCAKLQLVERSKMVRYMEEPRRYCQKRLVDPDHHDGTRWLRVLDRYCEKEEKEDKDELHETNESFQQERETPELCLSVLNIQYQGDVQQRKRPRTSFKYKNCLHGEKHRMFVKEIVDDVELYDVERTSELTCYGDYAKYFQNISRRSSEGSLACDKQKESKSVQVNVPKENKKPKKETKIKRAQATKIKINNDVEASEDTDTKVSFHKYGARKSLTITRAESPETLQIIRVDVVCNHSDRSTPADDRKQRPPAAAAGRGRGTDNKTYDKYLRCGGGGVVKTLDENVSGGKVTLLCKTFRLTDRCRRYDTETAAETRRSRLPK
ncbi:uncharacterized protein LOC121738764 [Aricia agestis]|uniref:uncharacterized protein LOC121738764 n=1 Tax=Aricia agestis TaxID=91739 RepID=UPI001C20415B|nr:uncharacterized protein LOC121738764 [Aricia agestis]